MEYIELDKRKCKELKSPQINDIQKGILQATITESHVEYCIKV